MIPRFALLCARSSLCRFAFLQIAAFVFAALGTAPAESQDASTVWLDARAGCDSSFVEVLISELAIEYLDAQLEEGPRSAFARVVCSRGQVQVFARREDQWDALPPHAFSGDVHRGIAVNVVEDIVARLPARDRILSVGSVAASSTEASAEAVDAPPLDEAIETRLPEELLVPAEAVEEDDVAEDLTSSAAVNDDGERRKWWQSWIPWTVIGVVVLGAAVGLGVSLRCPADDCPEGPVL